MKHAIHILNQSIEALEASERDRTNNQNIAQAAMDRESILELRHVLSLARTAGRLNPEDLNWCLTRLPKALKEQLEKRPGKVFVAGGYIRACIADEQVNDIDLFVPSKEAASELADSLLGPDKRRIETENAYTILGHKVPIQIIFRWTFDAPIEAIQSFDFTIASAAFWCEGDEFQSVCHPTFYQDLARKRLVYLSPKREEEAGGSLLRVLKFYQRGYRIPLDSLGLVIGRLLNGVPEENWKKREAIEPGEWETQMGLVITGLLREVDPLIQIQH